MIDCVRLRGVHLSCMEAYGQLRCPNREAVFAQILSKTACPKAHPRLFAPLRHGSELVPYYFRRDVLSACKSTEATIGAGDGDHWVPEIQQHVWGKGCSLSASYSC